MLTKEEPAYNFVNLEELLTPTAVETTFAKFNNVKRLFQRPSKENISSLSALEIAEQMTYFDQKILFSIRSE